jgi:hypothetical protein
MDTPKRSDRSSDRRGAARLARPFALLGLLLLTPDLRAAAAADDAVEDLLSRARREERELPRGAHPGETFALVESEGGLWASRARLARASAALDDLEPPRARAAATEEDARALGLFGLTDWIDVAAERGLRPLLDFAGRARLEPLVRTALTAASRLAKTPEEKTEVLAAWAEWLRIAPDVPRAEIALAISRTHLLAPPAAEDALASLAARFPDAPERAADLFDQTDRRAFDGALRTAPPEVRLARARALAPKQPDEALALVADLAATRRAEVADLLLATGRAREAAKILSGLTAEGAEAVHVEVLRALAQMREVGSKETAVRRTPKGRRRSRRARHAAPPVLAAELDARLGAEVERLLALPLSEPDRRRLLAEAVRFELLARHQEHARRHLADLLAASPTATAGSEEIFADAFALFRDGSKEDILSAARLLDEEASLYCDVMVRRRAVYWAARARARAGEPDAARPLYASLLSGPSPDLYAVWAAGELGVVLSPGGPAEPADGETVLSKESAGAPSRELLACGFPDLAEDQAEDEGSLDPLFGAALASERDDHRRAAHLLKLRWPELGTPDEGAVPLAARRAFYPLARYALVTRTAEENGLAASLLFALIRQESLFQPLVTSSAGAVGLMQVMPATGRLLARRERRRAGDLKDPAENLRLGARYLASLVRLFGGDEAAALAAYNAGPGRMLRWRREGKSLRRDELLESIPMKEPRDYVKRVLFFQGAYAALYGLPLAPGQPAPVRPRSL